ncbi:M20 family metallopeptidase [Halostagnicola sp. A-GB9-2]|uniref:M20 family metallopeptidase n=1 Tax=Halostagnicola sp. A-GB9-2 TaxID=3048066 RepID=UPI0024C0BC63|nr:M20 family metallopeptidase [Halostagnicola sp. A-GB9-2]MDJ1434284.1 M20 family metallopeptidase [Halostagnicola sp. A-GB9-2]
MAPEEVIPDAVSTKQSEYVSLLQELIQCEPVNPPGNEHRAADVIRPILDDLGFEVEEYTEVEGRPNLVARLEGDGDGPTLLMNAHMDVVPVDSPKEWPCDPFSGAIIDERVYGRGAVDHKSPIVGMLGAVETLQETGIDLVGDLVFVFDSNEERGGEHGMRFVAENADIDADMGIYAVTSSLSEESAEYFETQGRDNVHRANFGNQVFSVTVEGDLKHPMTPAETESAGERLGRLYPSLFEYCNLISTKEDDLTGSPNAEITTIESEGRPERASPEMTLHVRRYYAPSEESDTVFREFESHMTEAARKEGIADSVTVEQESNMPHVTVPFDHPLVESATYAASQVRDNEPNVAGVPAQTGITWLVRELDLPMILFGFGQVNLHHADPEWIHVDDLVDMVSAYALVYAKLLGEEAPLLEGAADVGETEG